MSSDHDSPPTIYDVARLSGLSIATISRVMNSPERVSEASRQKVMAAIDELGFVPQAAARARVLQNSGRVGVITPFFTSPSFIDRLRGVAAALSSSRYELIVYTVDSMSRLNNYLTTLPLRGNLDGLIIMSLPIDEETAQRLVANRLETVLVEYDYPGFCTVVGDDWAGGRLAAEHLIEQGHRRCGYIYFGQHPEYSIHPEVQRLAGFRQTLAEHGIPLPDEYVKYVPLSRQGVWDKLCELFELPEPPTGLFVPADELAIRVIHVAREAGKHVPDDISVIGFDNIDIAEHVALTTINQSLSESGKIAAELLLARLADRNRSIQQVRLPVRLEQRHTTRKLV